MYAPNTLNPVKGDACFAPFFDPWVDLVWFGAFVVFLFYWGNHGVFGGAPSPSGVPYLSKFGDLSIRQILVIA